MVTSLGLVIGELAGEGPEVRQDPLCLALAQRRRSGHPHIRYSRGFPPLHRPRLRVLPRIR